MVFDNTNLKSALCGGCDCAGFVPSASFVYDPNAKTMVVTDHTTYGAGDGRKIINIRVSDKNDTKAKASNTGGVITADLSGLDLSEGYQLFVTVLSNLGCMSDGHVGNEWLTDQLTGNVGSWDFESTKITINKPGIDEDDES